MLNVQLPGEFFYDTQMVMHTGTLTFDVNLTSELKKKHVYHDTKTWSD